MSGAILAVRLRALGDVVLVTPALRALKRGHPELDLEVVTDPAYAALASWLPEVSRVWPLERSPLAGWKLAAALRRRRYRWAVDFFGNPRSAALVATCGAQDTAGFDLRGRGRLYRLRVPRDAPGEGGRREHASAAHLRLAAAVGGLADGGPPHLPLPEEIRRAGAALLARAGVSSPARTVGLVAAGTWPSKTWPVSHAGLLSRRLLAAGREVLLLSGPGEESVAGTLTRIAPGVRLLPACDVAGLAGVIAHLEAVVGTDSGPRHIAAALDVPTYAWFGPTHPDTWQPPGKRHGFWRSPLPCAGCDRTHCPHWNCLPGLAPDEAAARVLEHLDRMESTGGHDPALRSAAGA